MPWVMVHVLMPSVKANGVNETGPGPMKSFAAIENAKGLNGPPDGVNEKLYQRGLASTEPG